MEDMFGIISTIVGITGIVVQAIVLTDMMGIKRHLKEESRKEIEKHKQWIEQVERGRIEKFSSPEDEEIIEKFIGEYLEWSIQQNAKRQDSYKLQ